MVMDTQQVIFTFRDDGLVDVHYNVADYHKALTEIQAYASKRIKYVNEQVQTAAVLETTAGETEREVPVS
jgi:hypothetical protein